jgi:hypothetical protein
VVVVDSFVVTGAAVSATSVDVIDVSVTDDVGDGVVAAVDPAEPPHCTVIASARIPATVRTSI